MQPKPTIRKIGIFAQILVVAVVIIAALSYQEILDAYALQTYKPRADVATIIDRLALTDKARATLYRADPKIDAKADFNRDCDTRPNELELGCYYRAHIYVLKIDNPALAGEMDVVMAHELLHAVWVKMGEKERKELSTELLRVYQTVTTDELKQRMEGYARTEPGEESNELHSILGTEFPSLSPVLEAHYAKYFVDRQKIVATHEAYQSVFSTRRAELEQDLAEIRAAKGQLAVLNRQLESYRAAGMISQYNALVPRQNRMVDDINQRIAAYRVGVEEFNALSASLDSQQITDTETIAE
jgi:hypothetical protein